MLVSVLGRVQNVQLRRSQALLPVFEAVINSIQAIEASSRRKSGAVDITVIRDERQGTLGPNEADQGTIAGFDIIDNGCGFDDRNMEAFKTSDTRLKLALGGKGIGRLLWLKAFDSVKVESVYQANDGALRKRHFRFELTEKGVEGERSEAVVTSPKVQTRVSLIGFKPQYEERCPKRLRTIGERVVEHCLSYFLQAYCPTITIRDEHEALGLNDLYEELFKTVITDKVTIQTQEFRVLQLRLYGSEHTHHLLHLCANERDVQTTKLMSLIPGLVGRLLDEDDKTFVWAVYVFGDYLDSHVHPERGGFTIPADDSADEGELLANEPSLAAIRKGIEPLVLKSLKPFLEPLERRTRERIEEYVEHQAPEYRAVLKHTDVVRRLSPDVSESDLERFLHSEKRDLELQVRKEGAELIAQTEIAGLPDEFVRKLIDISQANLVKYVLERRHMLDILSRSLAKKPDGTYQLEESIHKLIFPMRTTSDDVLEHNLWVIDDRLAYHAYLASDVPLSGQEVIESNSDERPDIVVFNNAFALSESGPPFSSVVILEFKRPARKDHTDEKNPITQVYGYIRKIREGTAIDRNGRPISIPEATPFYCYILCDLTPAMKRICENMALKLTPDSLGYFGFNDTLRAYVEVISYDKMVEDAKKRNRAFFDRLNVPM